ncbi:MAG: hypothetical protein IPL35_12130 [Sphingobacteriales bacterium]|nr:hypothetical protein [Sphingobacteriales bacterium]
MPESPCDAVPMEDCYIYNNTVIVSPDNYEMPEPTPAPFLKQMPCI